MAIRRTSSGYKIITIADSHDGGRNEVYEHRHVVHRHVGGPLPDGSVVHHRNRERGQNDIANLLLLPDQHIHNLLHVYMRKDDRRRVRAMERMAAEWMDDLRRQFASSKESIWSVYRDLEAAEPTKLSAQADDLLPTFNSFVEQVFHFRAKYPDYLMVIQVGAFYEAYDLDADHLHHLLGWKVIHSQALNCDQVGTSTNNTAFLDELKRHGVPFYVIDETTYEAGASIKTRVVREVWHSKSFR